MPTNPIRVISLPELDAFCYDSARLHRDNYAPGAYSVARVTRSRVHVTYRDDLRIVTAIYPCYPGAGGQTMIVLDALRYLDGAYQDPSDVDRATAGAAYFTPLERQD